MRKEQYLNILRLEQNGKYRNYIELSKDDLSRLERDKFQEYMIRYVESYDSKLCIPILKTYKSYQEVVNKAPRKDLVIAIADDLLREKVGIEDFIINVLTPPPKSKDLYPHFAKAFACICCINHKLSSGGNPQGNPSETVKPYLEEPEAREKVEKVKNAFFKAMEEIGYPVKEGYGNINTFLDERRVKRRIDSYVRAEIEHDYTVRDC